jgi:hypothetical protein
MKGLRNLVNLRVLVGSLLVGMCLFAALIAMLSRTRSAQPIPAVETAVLFVIPAPTATYPAPISSPAATPTSTASIPQPPQSGMITRGSYVQITGTGGDGLRLRAEPGLNGTVRFLGIEAEVFQVIDGPQEVDGYSWWFLQAPYDVNVQGWAVANYLVLVPNP